MNLRGSITEQGGYSFPEQQLYMEFMRKVRAIDASIESQRQEELAQ